VGEKTKRLPDMTMAEMRDTVMNVRLYILHSKLGLDVVGRHMYYINTCTPRSMIMRNIKTLHGIILV
jgi:hypothetical protein